MFTACSACTFLKNMLDKTLRSQTDVLGAIRKRLGQMAPCDGHAIIHSCSLTEGHDASGQHYAFQAAQRLAIAKCQELCRRTGDDWWLGSFEYYSFCMHEPIWNMCA